MTKAKGNSERDLQLDKARAGMLLRLFDLCYKLGVNDACACDDSGLIADHIERLKTPDKFGRINSIADDWLFWQLTLRKEILSNPLYRSAYSAFVRYAVAAGHAFRNYLGVAYSVCKAFYALGLKDWEKSRSSDLAVFNSSPKLRLRGDGSLKKWKTHEMVSDSQMLCYALKKEHAESDSQFKNSERQFTLFTRCLALASARRWDAMT